MLASSKRLLGSSARLFELRVTFHRFVTFDTDLELYVLQRRGVKVRSMSIARVRRTFKSLEQPEARTCRSPNFSACTRNHSRPERNLDRSRSPVQVESPGTGMARMSACTHRGLHRTLLIWNNALTFLYYALFNRKSIKPMTRRGKGVKMIILGSLLLIYDTSCFDKHTEILVQNVSKVGFVLVRVVRPTVPDSN